MYTTYGRDAKLARIGTEITHIGLITAAANFRTPSVTPAAFTGYARAAVTWGSAADTSPAGGRQRANSAQVEFPANGGGSPVAVIGWTGHTADTDGDIVVALPFSASAPFAAIARGASEDLYAPIAHGLEEDDTVYLMAAPGLPLPTGLAENTLYHVIATGLTANEFRLSATQGGSAVDITGVGGCQVIPAATRTLDPGAVLRFPIGTLVYRE